MRISYMLLQILPLYSMFICPSRVQSVYYKPIIDYFIIQETLQFKSQPRLPSLTKQLKSGLWRFCYPGICHLVSIFFVCLIDCIISCFLHVILLDFLWYQLLHFKRRPRGYFETVPGSLSFGLHIYMHWNWYFNKANRWTYRDWY